MFVSCWLAPACYGQKMPRRRSNSGKRSFAHHALGSMLGAVIVEEAEGRD